MEAHARQQRIFCNKAHILRDAKPNRLQAFSKGKNALIHPTQTFIVAITAVPSITETVPELVFATYIYPFDGL